MENIYVKKWLLAALLAAEIPIMTSNAEIQCHGILTDHQQKGVNAMFSPPYSSGTTLIGDHVSLENRFKKLSKQQLERLKTKSPAVAASYKLSDEHATLLKKWLNENAAASLPGWFTTVVGGVVPHAWVGITADVLIQLVNQSGDAGRLTVANIAGTVSSGGEVAVLEWVVPDKNGKQQFLYAYVYNYDLNAKRVTVPLTVCKADIAE